MKDERMAGKKGYEASLGDFQRDVDRTLIEIRDCKIMNRIWSQDHTVWKDNPGEISNRLGWLHSPEVMLKAIPQITDFVEDIRAAGYTHAVLMGMGGSCLAPEMYRFIFGVKEGFLDLAVLDSTDPGLVLEYTRRFDPEKTIFIVSTKSGGTVETVSFMKYFYNQVSDRVGRENTGERFIAITDAGSGLESMAKNLQFRKIFLNDSNIGGRYSALSYFGLVPAALIGMDLPLLLRRADTAARNFEGWNSCASENNSAARLGVTIGLLANAGKDKLTFILSPSISHFGAWTEQLVAESTGKEGKGIVPVHGEFLASPDAYAHDRLFVYLRLEGDSSYDKKVQTLEKAGHPVVYLNLDDPYDIGAECFRWEMATAVAGRILGINPFDQPDVESAKIIARQQVDAYKKEGKLPQFSPAMEKEGISIFTDLSVKNLREALEKFLSQRKPGKDDCMGRSYIALQAYVKPGSETGFALQNLRTLLQVKYRMATTVGYGPRFLHSTGQLHKGDKGNGLFIQLTSEMPEDVPIPDDAGDKASSITFGILKMAQAIGDGHALKNAGRSFIRFHFKTDVSKALKRLEDALK